MSEPTGLASVLTLLEERGILARVTRLRVGDVHLEMQAAPVPRSPVDIAKEEARKEESLDAFERRVSTGHAMRIAPPRIPGAR